MKTLLSALGAAMLGLLPINAQIIINPYQFDGGGGGPPSYTPQDSVTGTTNGSNGIGQGGLNVWAAAVQFTPSVTYSLTRVKIQAAKVGTPTQTYTCEIYTSVSNLPDTLVGSISAAVSGSTFPGTEGDVIFYPTATVNAGSTYFIVVRGSALDASNYVVWYRISATAQICTYNGSAWTSASTSRRSKFEASSTP